MTTRIKELNGYYLSRPVALISQPLGLWFCIGMGIDDPLLKNMEAVAAVPYIEAAGYLDLPGLDERLISYNRVNASHVESTSYH